MTNPPAALLRAVALLTLGSVAPAPLLRVNACDEDPASVAAAAATPLGQALARIEHQRARLIEAAQAGQAADLRRHAAAIGEAVVKLSKGLPLPQQGMVRSAAADIARLAEQPGEIVGAHPSGFSRLDLLLVQLQAPLINAAAALNQRTQTVPRVGSSAREKPRQPPGPGTAPGEELPPPAPAPSLRADILPQGPLQAGTDIPAILRLSRLTDGSPVAAADLAVTHTRRIHLLIVDESLGDYHHEHPEATAVPGEYAVTLRPRAGGRYRLFADVLPTATGQQEYVPAMIQVAGAPLAPDRREERVATVDGYRFELFTPGDNRPLRAGEHATVRVRVTAPDGRPAADLEPLMGAFAHGVGFSTDLRSVLHVHPLGTEPGTAAERGGPELDFHFLSEQPGFQRFYVQVQIAGRDRYAPFGLMVEPGNAAPGGRTTEVPPLPRAVPPAARGEPLAEADRQFLAAYEQVRAALAADDLPGVIRAAGTLPDESKRAFAAPDSLIQARTGFARLSALAVPLAAGRPGFHVLHCPMAKQSWVQTDERVANPFYGAAMLTCGSVVPP